VDPAVASADQPSRQMLVARAGKFPAATWFFAPDKELEYPAPDLSASLRELPAAGAGGGDTTGSADCGAGLGDKPGLGDQPGLDDRPPRRYRLRLKARSLVRDLVIHADLLDDRAAVSDQLLTLLPGESAEVIITSRRPMDRKALEAVTKCANGFGAAVARGK
jgi:beta-mannosidase